MSSLTKKVFIGLSGGVDSSVSAALLKNAGYDVTGVFIRVWQPPFFECSWKDDRLDAMRVCAKLNIPFVELDLEKEYKREVVDYMIREYKAGRTPNPDVFCNRFVKFGAFYRFARKLGADFIATGHYARIVRLNAKRYTLNAGLDSNKDQSYFLWQVRKEQLPHILFPVGGMQKTEVRRLAKKFGLTTADKKDSQGLCFVGKVDMKEFLSHYIKPRRGNVLDARGRIIGVHNGVFFYTIGERLGLPTRSDLVSGKRPDLVVAGPCYVIDKDTRKNTLTVSHKGPSGTLPVAQKEILIEDCNWLVPPVSGSEYQARVRYRQPPQNAKIKNQKAKWVVCFERPQTIASGQSLVLYDGNVVVGGGIIC